MSALATQNMMVTGPQPNRELFKHFNPKLVKQERMIPVSLEYEDNSEKLAPRHQRGKLTVAVEEGELARIASSAGKYYAENILIENKDSGFWPRRLTVEVNLRIKNSAIYGEKIMNRNTLLTWGYDV